jgi:transcriptional regulator with XRE-family HTH domain
MPHRPRDQAPDEFGTEIKRLGGQIRKVRTVRGWTLEEAADRASVDWKHLQKIEAGTLNPTVLTLSRIAKGFNVPLWVLFRGAD